MFSSAETYWRDTAASSNDVRFAATANLAANGAALLSIEAAHLEQYGIDGTANDELLRMLCGFLLLIEEQGGTVAAMIAANAACLADALTVLLTEDAQEA